MGDSATLKNNRLTACVDNETAEEVWNLAAEWDRTVSWTLGHLIELGLIQAGDDDAA